MDAVRSPGLLRHRLPVLCALYQGQGTGSGDRKSTRLNSSHANISYAVFCLKKKKKEKCKKRNVKRVESTTKKFSDTRQRRIQIESTIVNYSNANITNNNHYLLE